MNFLLTELLLQVPDAVVVELLLPLEFLLRFDSLPLCNGQIVFDLDQFEARRGLGEVVAGAVSLGSSARTP